MDSPPKYITWIPIVGGTFKMSFTNFTTGHSPSFGGEYPELKPHKLIRYTDVFDGPELPGEISVTTRLKPASVGTGVHIVQESVPNLIPAGGCHLGGCSDVAHRDNFLYMVSRAD
jgi:uncharacterized protein YndB with AHSA1/START domain